MVTLKQWLASWLAGVADNKICSSGLRLCSTCHLCVLEWSHYVCTSVCACVCVSLGCSTLSLPVKSSSIAPAVLWGYHRLSVWVCVLFSQHTVCTPCSHVSWSCGRARFSQRLFPVSRTPRSESEHASNIPTFGRRTTHNVVFSFTLVLNTLPGDSNHSLMLQCALLSYTHSLSLLVTELFVLSPREESWMKATGPECEVNI